MRIAKLGVLLLLCPFLLLASNQPNDVTRIGIIGLDTSHSIAFTKLLNSPDAGSDFAGYQVVAAYPHGSRDIESSVNRIPRYTEQIQKFGVSIVQSIDELLNQVDVVLLETNDGRRHLEQALQVFQSGKPVFIDKPVAASLVDAFAIYQAAEHYNVPVFSASSLRFMSTAQAVRNGSIGTVHRAVAYSPASLEETHPDLYWYGIHGVETLFTLMGTGCQYVQRMFTDSTDVVTGKWENGRVGTFIGTRSGQHGYGGLAFGSEAITEIGPYEGYGALVKEIIRFFETGKPPVAPEETIEIFAFMTAADMSKYQNGSPVDISQVLRYARVSAQEKLAGLH